MRERLLVIGMLAWAAAVVACAAGGGTGSPAAPPATGDHPGSFDHAGHLARGVECAFCHGEEDAEWKSLPALTVCQECHEELDGEKPPEKRAAASFDAGGAGRWVHASRPDPEIIFPHAAHVKGAGGECRSCHDDVISSTAVPRSAAFTMKECTACHERSESGRRYNRCDSCHREIREDVAPASHRMNWRERHGRVVPDRRLETLPEGCALCHTRSSCDECHRAEKPKSHNVLWRRHGHAAASSLDRESCRACHRTDSCDECHREATPANHRGAWGAPFDRHCNSCHLPLGRSSGAGCAVCHRDASGHDSAPPRPPNPSHMTSDPAACRTCHAPMPHPDNGQTCLFCHR